MSLTPIYISNLDAGLETNKKPFALIDQAFQELFNAYSWRGRVKKREGIKFAGRLARVITGQLLGVTVAAQTTINITNVFVTIGVQGAIPLPETNAEIKPGTFVITIAAPDAATFTDNGDGTFAVTGGGVALGSFINYIDGTATLILSNPVTGGANITANFSYFPSLSVMGIWQREIDGINNEQTIFFDRKYAYVYGGTTFSELSSTPAVTWNSSDSDFFLATNYRGSEPSDRLFFVTNFVNDSDNPMRYYDGTNWNTFAPTVGGQVLTQVLGTLTTPWNAFNGTLVPATAGSIIDGSVTIVVENEADGVVTFRDPLKNGTLSSSDLYSGTIDYVTGIITLTMNPAFTADAQVTATFDYGISTLWSALILIPYYGRMLALNVWEGTEQNLATNIFNRCRFSQVGNPIENDAWRSDVIGKGGFIDAPVNQEITSATFYKNTLIVFFEESTWQLRYVGEYGLPFIWERISSDYGGESTFSTILFDTGVLAVGDKAIVSSSGVSVERIDLSIPDLVFNFENTNFGQKRVHGIRDYKKELVYWTYPDGNLSGSIDQNVYPNKVLVYNYRNNTFAVFRENITCFGPMNEQGGSVLWNDTNIFWSAEDVYWKDDEVSQTPLIMSGNQEGFVHYYGYPNLSNGTISNVNAMDQESLSITGIDITVQPPKLTVVNHNIQAGDNDPDSPAGEIVYITGMNFLNSVTFATTTNNLNNNIYLAVPDPTDLDSLYLWKWDFTRQQYVSDFTVTASSEYVGGGSLTLFPNLSVMTKDFSPYGQKGSSTKLAYIDFLTDAMPNTSNTVNIYIDSSEQFSANLLIGNQNVSQSNSEYGSITGVSTGVGADPCVITTLKPHGLYTNDEVVIQNVVGTTEINGGEYTITYVSPTSFSIAEDATAFTTYVSGGNYIQTNYRFYVPGSNYAWHRFYCGSNGQFISMQMTYDNNLMNTFSTHQQSFVLNAMRLWVKEGGSSVF